MWDAETGAQASTLAEHSGTVWAVAWSPDGRYIASGGEDLDVHFWDARTGERTQVSDYRPGWVLSLAWSPDGRFVVAGGALGVARIWDAQSGTEVRVLDGQCGWVSAASWSPDGRRIATACYQALHVWEAKTGAATRRFDRVSKSISWSPDGRFLRSVCGGALYVWDVESGQETQRKIGRKSRLLSVAWSPDGRILVAKSYDGALEVWDTATWESVAVVYEGGIGLPWQPPDGRAFHPTLPLLATKGVRPSERIRILEFDIDALLGSPNGKAD
jgi:WD40 repeat protein